VFIRHLKWLLATVLIAGSAQTQAAVDRRGECFSVVVSGAASADGWVMMAHNEDDYIPQVVNHWKVARQTHSADEVVQLDSGAVLPQVPVTLAYVWSEIPGLLFSDSYLNEMGVCICSDACRSREDRPELTGGGISRMLRRIVAQRARTARQAVQIAGDLVERFGYASSGRTYIICDPNEGWLFCAVYGKHWVAQRVPDGQVALIANTYTVHEINLADTLNYLGSSDIIRYAIRRGWYDPQSARAFDFAEAYADSETAAADENIGRQWDGIRRIASDPPPYGARLPLSVRPKRRVDIRDVMGILRSHYEGTPLYTADSATGCPHNQKTTPICRHDTQTSLVAQLRGSMPSEIGLVYWVCLSSPCTSSYIPFHFGVDSFPPCYSTKSIQPTEAEYRTIVDQPFGVDETNAFWTFTRFRHHVEQHYARVGVRVRHLLDAVESRACGKQAAVEAKALGLLKRDRSRAMELLADYSRDAYTAALDGLRHVQFGK